MGDVPSEVPRVGETESVIERSARLAAQRVMREAQGVVGGDVCGDIVRLIEGPAAGCANGGTTAGEPAHQIVTATQDSSVDGFVGEASLPVPCNCDAGARIDRLRHGSCGGVAVGGNRPVIVEKSDNLAEAVVFEAKGLSCPVGTGDETACGVVLVGQGAAVEVGFRGQAARRVVGVCPAAAVCPCDSREAKLGVVGEAEVASVAVGGGSGLVEPGHTVCGGTTVTVGVGGEVAFSVPIPFFLGAIGELAPGALSSTLQRMCMVLPAGSVV